MNACGCRKLILAIKVLPLALALGAAVSCSSKEPGIPLHYVHGQVLQNGSPLKGAMIVFHPVGKYPEDLQKPLAYSDAEGRFKMTTDRPGDGVPLGQYNISVECRERTYTGAEKIKGRSLLPIRYSNPETSGLSFEVQEGKNELTLRLADK